MHGATSRKVAGSIPKGIIGFFIDIIVLASLMLENALNVSSGSFPLKHSFSRQLCCHMDPADRTVAPCLPSSYVSVSDNTRRSPNIYVRRQWTYSTTALIYVYHTCPFLYCGPGYHCRYSDSLRAGRPVDRIPVGARFSAPVQTDTGANPASYTMDTGSFPGVKRPLRGVEHLPHLAPWFKKE